MKITRIKSRVEDTSKRVAEAGLTGYKLGKRTSQVYGQTRKASTLYNVGKGVTRNLTKVTTIDNLPWVAGAVGLFIPVFFASPVMLALGIIVKYAVKAVKKK